MDIKWFDVKCNEGQASINENSITLNTDAKKSFEDAYRVKVGVDEKGNLILQPLTKDYIVRMNLNEKDYLKVQFSKTYARINSKELLSSISKALNLPLSKDSLRFGTEYKEEEGYLIIHTGKGDKE